MDTLETIPESPAGATEIITRQHRYSQIAERFKLVNALWYLADDQNCLAPIPRAVCEDFELPCPVVQIKTEYRVVEVNKVASSEGNTPEDRFYSSLNVRIRAIVNMRSRDLVRISLGSVIFGLVLTAAHYLYEERERQSSSRSIERQFDSLVVAHNRISRDMTTITLAIAGELSPRQRDEMYQYVFTRGLIRNRLIAAHQTLNSSGLTILSLCSSILETDPVTPNLQGHIMPNRELALSILHDLETVTWPRDRSKPRAELIRSLTDVNSRGPRASFSFRSIGYSKHD